MNKQIETKVFNQKNSMLKENKVRKEKKIIKFN